MEATFAGKTVLVTGADRGRGQALVDQALGRGAKGVAISDDSSDHAVLE
jgi:NAD(P)-dependent dehydrogenase (short-subunit alcohol dehydrogenase family)